VGLALMELVSIVELTVAELFVMLFKERKVPDPVAVAAMPTEAEGADTAVPWFL
jgi:hypothetical protein